MDFLISSKQSNVPRNKNWLYYTNKFYKVSIKNHFIFDLEMFDKSTLIFLGDCINPEVLKNHNSFSPILLKQIKGVFTLIEIKDEIIRIYSSYFGLLPVYYTEDFSFISNNPFTISRSRGTGHKLNDRFVLESLLFNYPFSNQSACKDIYRLGAFKYIELNNEDGKIYETENITSWFNKSAGDGKKELENLAELFIQESKHYFGDSHNTITFTSGFDGRTIVASGLYHGVNFDTFSMGRQEDDDIQNPLEISQKMDIPYHYYDLGGSEFINSYFQLSKRMSKLTGGGNGFLYPHFLYCAENESRSNKYLLTGYCGSELFRALHVQGAVVSPELFNIFIEKDDIKLKIRLRESYKLFFINFAEFEHSFEELFEEIISFRKNFKHFQSINHFLYYYVFEEAFRKVFGGWLTAQFKNIIVRVPFIDFSFVSELLTTNLAGCNNDFFTHNPFKRMKGQLLYSEILRKTNNPLYRYKTGKGYRPSDLSSLKGNIMILRPYLEKRIKRNIVKPYLDNLGLVSGYQKNKKEIERLFHNLDYFNKISLLDVSNKMDPYISESTRDTIFLTASIASIIDE